MAVHLTRIYTRTGDDGTTGLADFSRVAKTDPRLVAYADCDETNATLGPGGGSRVARSGHRGGAHADPERVVRPRRGPGHPDRAAPAYPPLRVTQDYIDRLEADCDAFNAELSA